MVGDTLQNPSEPCLWINAVEFGGFDQSEGATAAATIQPVLFRILLPPWSHLFAYRRQGRSAPSALRPMSASLLIRVEWARTQGCDIATGIDRDTMTPLIKITRPDKKRALIEVGVSQEDFLLPTQIAYYDRALGIESPWFSVNPNESEKA